MHNYEFNIRLRSDVHVTETTVRATRARGGTAERTRSPAAPRAIATLPAATAVEPAPAPLAPRALYQEVAERLRQQIFDRRLEPGAWIDELKLAAEFGISRTPMREALKVLAVEGLVTMKVRRGAYVTEMSPRDVTQVYHLLGLLESDAAGEVATQATDEQLAELRSLHERLEKQVRQRDAFFSTNERFHMRLLELAGNRWRLQMVADLRKVMKLNRHHSLFRQGRIAESLAEHRGVMEALERRDGRLATSLMQAHFTNGLRAAAE